MRIVSNYYKPIFKLFSVFSLVLCHKKSFDREQLRSIRYYFKQSNLTLKDWNNIDINSKKVQIRFLEAYLDLFFVTELSRFNSVSDCLDYILEYKNRYID